MRLIRTVIGLVAGVLLASPAAHAVERKGFVIGFGAGLGQTRVEGESNTGFASEFHIGGMIGPRTALLLDGSMVADSEEAFGETLTVGIGVGAIAVQHWVHDRIWVKGGIGQGSVFVSGGGESEFEEAGLGFLAGAGYEIVQKEKFTLDLQGRFTTSSKDDVRFNNVSAVLGVNWW
jgi:hypothetical protein